jgi:ABC-type dipeptide/oligopeptide/nickel transport system permease subunit
MSQSSNIDGTVAASDRPKSTLEQLVGSVLLLKESPVGIVGLTLVVFFIVVAVFAPFLAPYSYDDYLSPGAPPLTTTPNGEFLLLGADLKGRDIFSRLIYGTQRVVFYASVATFSAYVVGVIMGLAAGYFRGWIDELLSFVANVILSFPVMVLFVLIISTAGASGLTIVFAVVFASAPGIMRIVRGLTLDIATRDYIAAAQTRGEGPWYVMLVELLPNARGPLIVDACLRMGYTTITIGALGFLGLGLPPPFPDWGGMINETRSLAIGGFWWMPFFPALAVSLLVLGFNLLADGLREVSLRD